MSRCSMRHFLVGPGPRTSFPTHRLGIFFCACLWPTASNTSDASIPAYSIRISAPPGCWGTREEWHPVSEGANVHPRIFSKERERERDGPPCVEWAPFPSPYDGSLDASVFYAIGLRAAPLGVHWVRREPRLRLAGTQVHVYSNGPTPGQRRPRPQALHPPRDTRAVLREGRVRVAGPVQPPPDRAGDTGLPRTRFLARFGAVLSSESPRGCLPRAAPHTSESQPVTS